MGPPAGIERRKSDLADDPIDEEILREIREATDDAEKRRLMIDYSINRQLWRLGSLVSEISEKIGKQDETFEQHRAEIKLILENWNREYQAHRSEFMKHAQDEETLIAQGQTAYKTTMRIGGGVAVLILSLAGYIFGQHIDELRGTQRDNAAQAKAITDLEKRAQMLDDAFTRHIISNSDPKQAVTSQNGLKLPER